MQDSIVSVRMPESLFYELQQVAEQQHYMDLSEAVRSLIRRKIAQRRMEEGQQTEQLINGLQKIIDQLENGATQEQ